MKNSNLIFFIISILAISCNQNKFSRKISPNHKLIFGSGGGFTGEAKTYILLESGSLFYVTSIKKDTIQLKSIAKNDCRKIFRDLEKLHLEDKTIKKPGNIYYFIKEWKSNNYNEIVWGEFNYKMPENINIFYASLYKYLKKTNP